MNDNFHKIMFTFFQIYVKTILSKQCFVYIYIYSIERVIGHVTWKNMNLAFKEKHSYIQSLFSHESLNVLEALLDILEKTST